MERREPIERDDDEVTTLLLRLGDNALILSHRLAQRCGGAPTLEEDVALAASARALIEEAERWLGLAGAKNAVDADRVALGRDVHDFRNALIVELPNGDYGETVMRQFLVAAWRVPMLAGLKQSSDAAIAAIAAQSLAAAQRDLQRSADLVARLGGADRESRRRMQAALDLLWPYARELILADALDDALADAAIAPPLDLVRAEWSATVDWVLNQAGLARPQAIFTQEGGKRGVHTEHLGFVLAEMQFLRRAYPGARW